jgi:MerR family copper efflux transcriptional regulator
MLAKEASDKLGISQRMLRHYEKVGLMDIRRGENSYRIYTDADLRRAGRIQDFIATGFSTREILSMSACLTDEGDGPCEGGIAQMMEKLSHIDQLRHDLDTKREAVLERISTLRAAFPASSSSAIN